MLSCDETVPSSSSSSSSCRRLRVVYGAEVSGRMSIDRRTALNLELICNARRSDNYNDGDTDDAFGDAPDSSSTHSLIVECSGSQKESLFGSINNTKTVGR